jgi:hypothetical protein
LKEFEMKVFIGTHENCGIIAELSLGFAELGHGVTSFVKSRDKYFTGYKYSYEELCKAPRSFSGKVFQKMVPFNKWLYNRKLKSKFQEVLDNDLFIYTWDSLLPNLEDVLYLRRRNKKIVFLFIGSDVRYAKAFQQEFQNVPIPWAQFQWNENLNKKLYFIRNVELNVDQIYSLPDQAGLQIRAYNHLYLPFNAREIKFNYPDNEVPIIVHAPSNPHLKGTEVIMKALDELKDEGLMFEMVLMQNKNNSEVRECLLGADIVIDQIYFHGPGMFGLEAMASGCALATKYFEKYSAIFAPPACYIDNTTILKTNLRKLITDREYRKKIAYEGRKFVERVNSPKNIANKITLDLSSRRLPDYAPDFFIKQFQLNGQSLRPEIKELNSKAISRFNPDGVNQEWLIKRGLV